ncbi:hypothetical protein Tco_0031172 [Tanacetum coccineum]
MGGRRIGWGDGGRTLRLGGRQDERGSGTERMGIEIGWIDGRDWEVKLGYWRMGGGMMGMEDVRNRGGGKDGMDADGMMGECWEAGEGEMDDERDWGRAGMIDEDLMDGLEGDDGGGDGGLS